MPVLYLASVRDLLMSALREIVAVLTGRQIAGANDMREATELEAQMQERR